MAELISTEPVTRTSPILAFVKSRNGIIILVLAALLIAAAIYIFRPVKVEEDRTEQIILDRLDQITDDIKKEIKATSDTAIELNARRIGAAVEYLDQKDFKIIKERTRYETIIMQYDTVEPNELNDFIEQRMREYRLEHPQN